MNDELEPGPSNASFYVLELRAFADFIEEHPAVAEGRTLDETMVAVEDAMHDLQSIEHAEADDFNKEDDLDD